MENDRKGEYQSLTDWNTEQRFFIDNRFDISILSHEVPKESQMKKNASFSTLRFKLGIF